MICAGKQEDEESSRRFRSTPCRIGCHAWCKKYFWEGQLLDKRNTATKAKKAKYWLHRCTLEHRRFMSIAIPVCLFQFCWWSIAITSHFWHLFETKYFMTITMIFGGIMGGMTSEGGGAVAFPAMTLAFNIEPAVARDFTLMIQSCGLAAAACTIFFMKVKLEYHSLAFCSLGGVAGTVFGLHVVDPFLSASMKKMLYVSIWFSSSVILFCLNIFQKRKTHEELKIINVGKLIVMVATGFLGGIFTSFAGSGINICYFIILTLFFRLSEKVATPTSVVLMAGNSLVGFFWKGLITKNIEQEAWEFMAVCVPIVVISAPLGSIISSFFNRHVLSGLVCIVDTVALVGAFVLVKQTPLLAGISVGIILGGSIFFFMISILGGWVISREDLKTSRMELKDSDSLGEIPSRLPLVDSNNVHAGNKGKENVSTAIIIGAEV